MRDQGGPGSAGHPGAAGRSPVPAALSLPQRSLWAEVWTQGCASSSLVSVTDQLGLCLPPD